MKKQKFEKRAYYPYLGSIIWASLAYGCEAMPKKRSKSRKKIKQSERQFIIGLGEEENFFSNKQNLLKELN